MTRRTWLLPSLMVAALRLSSLPGSLEGQAAPSDTVAASDVLELGLVRPGLFQKRDLLLGVIFLGSAASIEIEGLDEIDHAVSPRPGRHGALDRSIPRNIGRLQIATGLSAGTFLLGELVGSSTTARVGLRSLETVLFNAVVTTAVKIGVGRARPDSGLEEDQFRPFSLSSDHWSFPSGHTSTMFALATIISSELHEEAPWVPFVAYPIAAWTGYSRMLDSRHWFTDVAAGAALGILSGRLVSRFHGSDSETTGLRPRLLLSAGEPFVLGVSFNIR